ncbi:MAG: acetyltransferase [Flavobacterium sp. JAD_PAG50586_2]|nr:MAG: acetyltransferase [Flavobacterium sp. JAD_PAG50586_2]
MIIIGARGFAKEVLEVLHQLNQTDNVAFYDDVNSDVPEKLYNQFPVLTSLSQAEAFFKSTDNKFTIGIGNPILRKQIFDKFSALGGQYSATISPKASIGNFNTSIGKGCNIMTGAVITNDIVVKDGALINLNCTIGHDSVIGQFVEMSPGVHISGNCTIGDYSILGTNATMLPRITIGKNVTIGAGSVITKDIPDNCVAVGVPAKIVKELPPLNF